MFWLALAGFVIAGVFKMIGQDQKNAADKAKLEAELPVYDHEQAALRAQLAYLANEKGRAKKIEAINVAQITRTATYQETGVARQGEQAVGSAIAVAGASNLGGTSVLRRVDSLKYQTSEQLNLIAANAAGDVKKQELGLKSTLGSLDVQSQNAQVNLMKSNANEASAQNDLTFLQDYGWMLTLGQGISTATQAFSYAAGFSGDSGSLATESYTAQQPYDYSNGGALNLGGLT